MKFHIEVDSNGMWWIGETDGQVEFFDTVDDAAVAARWYLDVGTSYRVVDGSGVEHHRATIYAPALEAVHARRFDA